MAWVKIPPEHHPLFHACLPRDPGVSTVMAEPEELRGWLRKALAYTAALPAKKARAAGGKKTANKSPRPAKKRRGP